jgi:hypothetical protein
MWASLIQHTHISCSPLRIPLDHGFASEDGQAQGHVRCD